MERQRPRKIFGVSFEEARRHDVLREQYLSERTAAIRAGEDVWKVRSFSYLDASEIEGPVFDYYSGGFLKGFVEGDDANGYHVYGPALEEGEGPHHLNTEPVESLDEAREKLEDYLKDTDLSPESPETF